VQGQARLRKVTNGGREGKKGGQKLPRSGLVQRWASGAAGSGRLPGRADGYPSGPPTDPYVRHERIRFLRHSFLLPLQQCHGGVVTRLVSAESLSCVSPLHALPDVAFPPVGRLGLTSPPCSVLCDAATALLSLAGCVACRSRPDPLRAPGRLWSPVRARVRVEAPRTRQGLWSPGPPCRALRQGDQWLSHVPEFPL